MDNFFKYFMGLLAIITATSMIAVTSQEHNNATWNNIVLNNTTLNNTNMNISAMNKTAINTTNETAFRIGNEIEGNRSAFTIGLPIRPLKDAGKLGYIIQATPHGTV